MALSLFQVRRSTGNPRGKPLAVGKGHEQIIGSLPDHGRYRDLVQVEPPRSDERQVVVHTPVHPRSEPLAKSGGYVVGELVGQDGSVDVGKQRSQRGGNVGAGDVLDLFSPFEEAGPQLVLALGGGGELDDVLLAHAHHPVQTVRVVGGGAGDYQHRRGGIKPRSAGQGVGSAAGPSGHEAAFGADRGENSAGVCGHVCDAAAGLATRVPVSGPGRRHHAQSSRVGCPLPRPDRGARTGRPVVYHEWEPVVWSADPYVETPTIRQSNMVKLAHVVILAPHLVAARRSGSGQMPDTPRVVVERAWWAGSRLSHFSQSRSTSATTAGANRTAI